jgi:hypothetical protein
MVPPDELMVRPETALDLAVQDVLHEREEREFTPAERTEFWRSVFRTKEQARDEDWIYCLHCAWRMVRELARLKRMFRDDGEKLESATRMTPSPWSTPTGIFDADAVGIDPLVAQLVTLLPPARGDGKDPLDHWLYVMAEIADRIGLYSTDEGVRAAKILLDPTQARGAWPTPQQLMDYDEIQADRVLELLCEKGELGFISALRGAGYREGERALLLATAKKHALALAGKDTDVDRATMILRLKSVIARAKESGRLHAELSAERTLAAVQGLAQAEATSEEIRDMASHVRGLPPPTSRRLIPSKTNTEKDED